MRNSRSVPNQVRFVRFDKFGALENLPKEKENDGREDHGIVSEEGTDVKASGHKVHVAIADNNTDLEAEGEDSAPRLEVGIVWKLATVESLGFTGAPEEYVVDTDDDIINDTTGSNNVHEPIE